MCSSDLNPYLRIEDQLIEPLLIHGLADKASAKKQALAMRDAVGIQDAASRIRGYPHEFSGGMRQRVMIAMALITNPEILIADEPTTALDVTVQAQILRLLKELRDDLGISVIFITHDLGVVAEIADDIAVMYRGKIVEQGSVLSIFENPKHPYTKGLLACRPRLDSTFTILPTVADYLEVIETYNGETELREKKPDLKQPEEEKKQNIDKAEDEKTQNKKTEEKNLEEENIEEEKVKSNQNIESLNKRSEERRVGKECRSRWSPYH